MRDKVSVTFKGRELKESECGFLNKATLFGENPFTCFKMVNGEFQSLDLHLERLKKSYEFLYEKDFESVSENILKDLNQLRETKGTYYIRITFFESLQSEDVEYFLIKKELSNHDKEVEVNVCFSNTRRVRTSLPSFLKLGNYSDSEIELRSLKSKNIQEVVYLNEEGQITEASKSNVFLVKGDKVITPKISYGVLEGVIRANLIKFLNEEGIEIVEREVGRDELLAADEVWLTNAIKGLRAVSSFEGNKLDKQCYNKVNEKFSLYMNKRGNHE